MKDLDSKLEKIYSMGKGKIAWMYSLGVGSINLGLERIKKLCDLLGNPQDSFRSIHIAGTNGKGSTAKMIYSILREKGLSVGLYTSPHLVRFNERIMVDDYFINDEELSSLIDEIKLRFDDHNSKNETQLEPTFFEFTTALAFLYFSQKKTDYVVLETGLGGRLDATNVVFPEITIITSISMDHMDYLGDTKEKILREKLGIVKKGKKLICALNEKNLINFARDYCKYKKSHFELLGEDFKLENIFDEKYGQVFDYIGKKHLNSLKVPLIGHFQAENAALAVRVIESLFADMDENVIRKGLEKVKWRGRFEIISENPLIIFDCGHNIEGFQKSMDSLDRFDFENLIPVVGFSKDKEIEKMLSLLKQKTDEIILSQSDFKPFPAQELAIKAREHGFHVLGEFQDPNKALVFAKEKAGEKDCILVIGSIYMLGMVYDR